MFLSCHIDNVHGDAASVFGNHCTAVLVSVEFQGNLFIDQVQSVVYTVQWSHFITASFFRDLTSISKKSEYRICGHVCGCYSDGTKQSQICLSRHLSPAIVEFTSAGSQCLVIAHFGLICPGCCSHIFRIRIYLTGVYNRKVGKLSGIIDPLCKARFLGGHAIVLFAQPVIHAVARQGCCVLEIEPVLTADGSWISVMIPNGLYTAACPCLFIYLCHDLFVSEHFCHGIDSFLTGVVIWIF